MKNGVHIIKWLQSTCNPGLRSWVVTANAPGHPFPIQNLPFGVFKKKPDSGEPHIGMAIGDFILDLKTGAKSGCLEGLDAEIVAALQEPTLNKLMGFSFPAAAKVRIAASCSLMMNLQEGSSKYSSSCQQHLIPMKDAVMVLPVKIGEYTDFYASLHHATRVGKLFRPENPLLPNYKHVPIGYHGRASSIVVSGTGIRRPWGQIPVSETAAEFKAEPRLDYEMEMGLFIGGPGNPLGEPVPIEKIPHFLFGLSLFNDLSARAIQKWEYQPLGPFLGKSFGSVLGPWVVTMEALEPFRVPGPPRGPEDPVPLDYLKPLHDLALDITVDVYLQTKRMREESDPPYLVSRGNLKNLYWTFAQMVAHHASNGCNLRPGDLLASGTISGADDFSRGCLLEITSGGKHPLVLPNEEQRTFLLDHDHIIMTAFAEKAGHPRIGFGTCETTILPSPRRQRFS